VDADNSLRKAESAVETAKNNLKIAEGGSNSQIVNQAYETAVSTLQSTLPKIDDALTQADNILAVDNVSANLSFRDYLGGSDPGKVSLARLNYSGVKAQKNQIRDVINALGAKPDQVKTDEALAKMQVLLGDVNSLLAETYDLLVATPAIQLTQVALDAKKTVIQTTRSGITAQSTALLNQKQALVNAKNSLESYAIAYTKAVKDLDEIRATSDNTVRLREAAYTQAVANYQSKINPPRAVDVASYRAAVAQAAASRDKGIMRAPIDGIVTKIGKKPGELVSGADVMVDLLSPHYEVAVDISEVDIRKVKINDKVTITLDALNADTKLTGKVVSIDPGPTIIQDVVYYKVKVSIDETAEPVKPGMTANVSIVTDERKNVAYVPSRAVKYDEDGSRYVKVLENGIEKNYPVQVGLKANEGRLEILEGLAKGQEVIISKQEKK
jgi:RND family efflux transporter MFP subunit